MSLKKWNVCANLPFERDAWLCDLFFDNDDICPGERVAIREGLFFLRAIKFYLRLSKMGYYCIFYKS